MNEEVRQTSIADTTGTVGGVGNVETTDTRASRTTGISCDGTSSTSSGSATRGQTARSSASSSPSHHTPSRLLLPSATTTSLLPSLPFPSSPPLQSILKLSPSLSYFRTVVGSSHEDFLLARRLLSSFLSGHIGSKVGGSRLVLGTSPGTLGLVFWKKRFHWLLLPLLLLSKNSTTATISSHCSPSSVASIVFSIPSLSSFLRIRAVNSNGAVWLEVMAAHPAARGGAPPILGAVVEWIGSELMAAVKNQQQILRGRKLKSLIETTVDKKEEEETRRRKTGRWAHEPVLMVV
eukprot:GHVS01074643.1.p1 GENE.GHVS01074643.1~~GHVS01074643.1.p1  ORF type:complete len:292 (-),score=79.07 GHVS01074643.1:455-1330(-)